MENSSWLGLKRDARRVKIRLAYIDTPELRQRQPGAAEAKTLLQELLTDQQVLLEYEEMPTGGPRKGDYNRMLAVVHLERLVLPNVNVNELLLRKGLARMYHNPDDITPHHWGRFTRAERYAKARNFGIWQNWNERTGWDMPRMLWYVLLGAVLGFVVAIIMIKS